MFDAMILAAGKGTRLSPLTDTIPKALVEVGELPVIDLVANRLIEAGADRLIVNTHTFRQKVADHLERQNYYGVEGFESFESPDILDTGGGLYQAKGFFRTDRPFLLHNVDVLSRIDLEALYDFAKTNEFVAVLAVNRRDSNRYLLFDNVGLLGHGNRNTGKERRVRQSVGATVSYGFCGVHAISPRIFDLTTERGAFSIISLYLRLAEIGEEVVPWEIGDVEWIDIGTHGRLDYAREVWSRDSF